MTHTAWRAPPMAPFIMSPVCGPRGQCNMLSVVILTPVTATGSDRSQLYIRQRKFVITFYDTKDMRKAVFLLIASKYSIHSSSTLLTTCNTCGSNYQRYLIRGHTSQIRAVPAVQGHCHAAHSLHYLQHPQPRQHALSQHRPHGGRRVRHR